MVDEAQRLTGIFSINDIRGVLFDQEIGDVVVAKDVANSRIITTRPSEDLNEVLKKFTLKNLNQLPVVEDEDPGVLLGMLDRREVIQFYNQRIQEIRTHGKDTPAREVETLPVINPKDRTVLGIISRSDILKTLHRSISR